MPAGSRVTLIVEDVPPEVLAAWNPAMPWVVWSLLEHECKMSVVNYVLKMEDSWTTPIKSKERLIFHTGIRTFAVRPIFSQHTSADKHKFERFLQPGTTVVASCIAPVTFPPMPVLVFKYAEEAGEGEERRRG